MPSFLSIIKVSGQIFAYFPYLQFKHKYLSTQRFVCPNNLFTYSNDNSTLLCYLTSMKVILIFNVSEMLALLLVNYRTISLPLLGHWNNWTISSCNTRRRVFEKKLMCIISKRFRPT